MQERHININDFDYPLPDERIAKFPLARRDESRLLVYRGGDIAERRFRDLGDVVPEGSFFVFNNTKVVRARLVMHKDSGARVEVFCLEPHAPADYERAFAVRGGCEWSCIVGNLKKWKSGEVATVSVPSLRQKYRCRMDMVFISWRLYSCRRFT